MARKVNDMFVCIGKGLHGVIRAKYWKRDIWLDMW